MSIKIIPTIWINFNDEFNNLLDSFNELKINTIRINCTRHDINEYIININKFKEVCNNKYGYTFKLVLDIPVPYQKIRLQYDWKGEELHFCCGDITNIVCGEKLIKSNLKDLLIKNEDVFKKLEIGDKITVGEGKPQFIIKDKKNDDTIVAECIENGIIPYGKYITSKNLKFFKNDLFTVEQYKKLIKETNPEYVALSFVSSKKDIIDAIEDLEINNETRIISKIESQQGIDNLEEIINASSSIMVARGDLLINCGYERFGLNNQLIINESIKRKRPYLVATGILENINEVGDLVSRAEVLDLFNILSSDAEGLILGYNVCKNNQLFKYAMDLITRMEIC